MSTSYNIFPLAIFSNDPSWLISRGFVLPPGWQQSRTPTIEDFRTALSTWDDCEYQEETQGEDLTIWATKRGVEGYTIISIYGCRLQQCLKNHTESETSRWLSFSGNPSWVVEVTKRLTQQCGPFLLTDSGGTVTIVAQDTSPDVVWINLP